MFSNESFKYLKSLRSSRKDKREKPAQFEDEFIVYAQTLVQGLNFVSDQVYILEKALPGWEGHDSMLGVIKQTGKSSDQSFLKIKTTSKGKFQLEWHIAVDDLNQTFENEENSLVTTTISQSPIFNRYFSLQQDTIENHQIIKFEMPLRQLRSRNLVEYSIFVFNLAQPFIEQLKSFSKGKQSIAA